VASMNSAAFISKPDRAKLAAKGRDPDAIATQRAKARFDNIIAGTVTSSRHQFQRRDPLERMCKVIAAERVAAVVAEMAQKPSKEKIAAMTARLLRMGTTATEIRSEAIERLDAAKKFASSAVVDRLTKGLDDDDDKEGDSQVVLEAA
jgi:hypothetical protein